MSNTSTTNPGDERRKKVRRLRWRLFFLFWSLILGLTLGVILAGCSDRRAGVGGGTTAETTISQSGMRETTGESTAESTKESTKESGGVETKGATVAPDLVSVGNLRPGPVDNNGSPRTFVDFTFNQPTYLTGSNRTGFALVPVNGDDSKYGSDFIPSEDTDPEGDEVVTVLFDGELKANDFARGFISNKAVSSGPQGNEPLNINQTKPLKPNTDSANPDLESVEIDCQEKQVTFTFDEGLDQEDVIQNTGGLRVYFKDTKNAGAQAVNQTGDPAVVKGAFIELPQGKKLKDAVGAYVTNGTVAGKPQMGDNKTQKINQLAEIHPVDLGDSCE